MAGIPVLVTVLMLVIAGCSSTGTPATAPPPAPTSTSTIAPTTTTRLPTTTVTAATTTIVDRVVEIEAIFQDLEERRLQALYEGDKEAFKALFANNEYMQRSLGAFDIVRFEGAPEIRLVAFRVMHQGDACMAAQYGVERLDLGETSESTTVVAERILDSWGLSFAGEGWACEGPHPFSP